MKIKFLTMATAAAMMLGACSDEKMDLGENNGEPVIETQDGVYFEISFDLPNASGYGRSVTITPEGEYSTSSDGVEVGKDYENAVNDAIVLLAEPTTYNFIAAATVNSSNLEVLQVDKSSYRALSKFSKTQLSAYYDKIEDAPYIDATVFVFCNPTNELNIAIFGDATDPDNKKGAEVGSDAWIDAIGTLSSGSPIWTSGNFLMSNSNIANRKLPGKMNDWNHYTTSGKPFDLSGPNTDLQIDNVGAIKVERAAARFDFRDGSWDGKNAEKKAKDPTLNGIGDFTYEVVTKETLNEDGSKTVTPIINIQLQKMSLVNMNKKYYFLRRVSGDGAPTGAQICMPERPWGKTDGGGYVPNSGNYVVDADYAWKQTVKTQWGAVQKPATTDFSSHFTYPLFNNDGSIDNTNLINDKWGTSMMSQVVNRGEDDNDDSWNNDKSKGDYKIWRYLTENTISGVSGQINGISTGVVFKGIMKATEQAKNSTDADIKALAETINMPQDKYTGDPYKAPILYLFAGALYPTWNRVRDAAIAAAVPEFKWIPQDGDKPAHYELSSINRSNSLYHAVFGTGGFGTQEFELTEMDPTTNRPVAGADGKGVLKKYTISDTKEEDTACANAAWNNWDKAQRPNSGAVKETFKKTVTAANITIYQSSNDPSYGWGYYCYYYYWNRHNDNGYNGVMFPMEFAVVRNNVYKLAITKLSRLGHPRVSENDPEPPTPGTPDESQDVYLTVKTEVLPWVVRINDIEF